MAIVSESGAAGARTTTARADDDPPATQTWPQMAIAILVPAILCLGCLTALVLFGVSDEATAIAIEPGSHARQETGFAVYRQHCAQCHGLYLQGASAPMSVPALDESGHAMLHDDADLARFVLFGARDENRSVTMPSFRNVLTAQEIGDVLSYVSAWWPDAVRARRTDPNWQFPADCSATPPSGTRH